jgi:hypothetical protein
LFLKLENQSLNPMSQELKVNSNMRSIIVCLLLGLTVTVRSAAQAGSPAGVAVKEQAQCMASALAAGDYKTFARYNNPAVKQLAGGEEGLARTMEKVMGQMKAQGMSFSKVTIGEPSAMLKSGAEWQCTIPQATEIKMQGGRVGTKSTLIAISTDGGKNWTFVDTSNKDLAMIRKLLPHLNPGIVIPPPEQPVRYAD